MVSDNVSRVQVELEQIVQKEKQTKQRKMFLSINT